jgi:hypothetical protein
MAKDDEKQPTAEEIAAQVARALLRIPAPEKKPRKKIKRGKRSR